MIDEIRLSEKSKWLVEPTEGEYGKGWNDCNKHWIEVIKEMPKSGEWIPCSERLPEKFGKYLVTEVNIFIPQIRLFEGTWDALNEVIAWMPLPERHKEGESDGH